MRRWIWLIGLWACESEPPAEEVCVQVELEGEHLRAMAAYFDEGRLVEVIDDVPVEQQQACLRLRPPTDQMARPATTWTVVANGDPSGEEPVWPIDIALYADLDRNGRADVGELRGRMQGGRWPAWVIDYERRAKEWLNTTEEDFLRKADLYSLIVWSDIEADSRFGWGEVDVPPQVLHFDSPSQCAIAMYPSCLPRAFDNSVLSIAMIDPRLPDAANRENRQRRSERSIWPFSSMNGVAEACGERGHIRWARYRTGGQPEPLWMDCTCMHIVSTVYVETLRDQPVDWLACPPEDPQ